MRFRSSLLVALAGASLSLGCAAQLNGRADMPHPLSHPARARDGSLVSDGISIKTRDPSIVGYTGMYAPRNGTGVGFRNDPIFWQTAFFEMRSPNRVDFLVELQHRSKQLARATDYEIWLEDDSGQRFTPDEIREGDLREDLITMKFLRTNVPVMVVRGGGLRDSSGGISAPSPYVMLVNEETDRSVRMPRQRVLLSFHRSGLISPATRGLTLVLQSRYRTLRFAWTFLSAEGEVRTAALQARPGS